MTHLASIISWMSGCLWILQLSMTRTEFGAGNCCIFVSRPLMKFENVSVQNDPSTMLQCMIPSRRDNAGRTEKLYRVSDDLEAEKKHLPTSSYKKCLALCFGSSNWPCMSTVRCPTINRAFINKYEQFRLIFANSCNVLAAFLSRTLSCNTCDL